MIPSLPSIYMKCEDMNVCVSLYNDHFQTQKAPLVERACFPLVKNIIGTSRSEPHINHSYEKIAVLMYVCMYVCMTLYVCSDMLSTCSTHARARKLMR